MRFKSIQITNYRPYGDFRIDFDSDMYEDIHFIFSPNGCGKTNFLNAISWCLFNEHNYSYNSMTTNIESISDAEARGKSFCPVSVKIILEEAGNNIVFERRSIFDVKINMEIKNTFDISTIKEDGELISYIEEEMKSDLVEKYFPYSKIPYFLIYENFIRAHYNSKEVKLWKKFMIENIIQSNLSAIGAEFETFQRIGKKVTQIFIDELKWKTYGSYSNPHIEITHDFNTVVIDENGCECEDIPSMDAIVTINMATLMALLEISKLETALCIDTPFSNLSNAAQFKLLNLIFKCSKNRQVIILEHPSKSNITKDLQTQICIHQIHINGTKWDQINAKI